MLGLALLVAGIWVPAPATLAADLTIYELLHHDAGHRVITAAVAGEPIHPLVVFEEGDHGFPTGTVSFAMYAGTSCAGTPVSVASRVAISGGIAHGTGATATFEAEGWFCTRMSYVGDANFNAVSLTLTREVLKRDPTVISSTHDESHAATTEVPLFTKVHLQVQVTGLDGQALDGPLTLYHYVEANCGGFSYGHVGSLVNGVFDGSGGFAYTAPVTRSFRARFEGNVTYRALSGACHNVRWRAIPTMTVSGPHDGHHRETSQFEPNDVVHLRVVMSGGFGTPQGLGEIVAWKNGDCTGAPYASSTGPLVDGIQDGNAGVAFNTLGIASVRARYLGDSQYLDVEGHCIPVAIAIAAASPSPSASATPTQASPSAAPTTVAAETAAPSSSAPAGSPPAFAASNRPSATAVAATPSPATGAPSPAGASLGVDPSTAGSSADQGESGSPGEPGTATAGDVGPDGAGASLVLLAGTGLVGFLSLLAAVAYRRFGGRRLGHER
jgi:hypothetical protein